MQLPLDPALRTHGHELQCSGDSRRIGRDLLPNISHIRDLLIPKPNLLPELREASLILTECIVFREHQVQTSKISLAAFDVVPQFPCPIVVSLVDNRFGVGDFGFYIREDCVHRDDFFGQVIVLAAGFSCIFDGALGKLDEEDGVGDAVAKRHNALILGRRDRYCSAELFSRE